MLTIAMWAFLCWVLLASIGAAVVSRRKRFAALAVIPALAAGLVLTFVYPPTGQYDPIAANYWIGRAAAATDSATKEAHVRRVALDSPQQGWFIASQAIATVESPVQRCRLRTILAGIPEIKNKERLGTEASAECNATLPKG